MELEDVPVVVAQSQPEPVVVQPPPQPRKRGRPKGSKNKPKQAQIPTVSLRPSTSRNVPDDILCESFVIRRNLRAHSDNESIEAVPARPTMPSPLACGGDGCSCEIVLGQHFDRFAWQLFKERDQVYRRQHMESTSASDTSELVPSL